MADENKPQPQPNDKSKSVVNDRPQMPAKAAALPEYKVETDASGEEKIVTGNMTRDAIISFQRGKFMEQGKTIEEATELAVKRGFEMVKDAPEKK
jgi:hypothetical protein